MNRKKINTLVIFILIGVVFIILFNTKKYIDAYNTNYNIVVTKLFTIVKEKYPNVSLEEFIEELNKEDQYDDKLLGYYGIDIYDDVASLSSKRILNRMYITDLIILVISSLLIILIINIYIYNNNKNIKRLIYYVEEINKKNYKLDLISNKEGYLSILQNEIYKTMVMLKESAVNSLSDKQKLKDSLSDVSHQLKTPLTSIGIMLDNIIDDENMSDDIRKDFIMDIKRELVNINFLVYNILKLSLFDTNTVKLKKECLSINKVIEESIKNVSLLADLKNIEIKFEYKKSDTIKLDFKWEVEALTNIIKNSIEHSYENGIVLINIDSTDLYTEVIVKDFGCGIDKKNIKNIFKRFYKLNDNDNGFGIGLSLAKEIVEADNGRIKVKSELGKGTSFIIRYMK